MNDIDYLLLDYLCALPSDLNQLRSDCADELFNKASLNLNEERLIAKLKLLIDQGYVLWMNDDLGKIADVLDTNKLNSNSLFGLSASGGRAWESKYDPKWECFICDEISPLPNNLIEVNVGCYSKATLEYYLSPISTVTKISLKEVLEWKPFYWKTLPSAVVSTFKVNEKLYEEKVSERKPDWRYI